MSPDIEWHVGDEADKETIAKTPPPRSSLRGRKVLIAVMVIAGISLGIVYSSIPESAPRPTPLPSPTPHSTPTRPALPTEMYDTVNREAQALADGDLKGFLTLQDRSDGRWFQAQIGMFRAWGRPFAADSGPIAFLSRPLYTVFEAGTLSSGQAWADISQFRHEQYFRETRFYHQVNGRWLRTSPDPSFWREPYQSLQTKHFEVSYPAEDNTFIQMVARRFEAAYDRVCADLDCPADAAPIQLAISPSVEHPQWSGLDQHDQIVLPSPRISGIYDTVYDEAARRMGDPVTQAAYQSLVSIWMQRTSGSFAWMTSDPTHGGTFFVSAIVDWENNRVSDYPDANQLLPPPELITNTQFVRLESLWDAQSAPSNPEQVADSVILFIEQKFGAAGVGKFLRAIGPARSFAQAIEASLGIDEASFEQQWKDWLRQLPLSLTPTQLSPIPPPQPLPAATFIPLPSNPITRPMTGWTNRIAYRGDDDGLWLMKPDGSNRRRIHLPSDTGSPSYDTRFVWSPEGARIAFVNGSDLLVTNLSTGVTRLIYRSHTALAGPEAILPAPAWNPDGTILAFIDGRTLRLARLDTEQIQQIADNVWGKVWANDPGGSLAWTADGRSILYLSGGAEFSELRGLAAISLDDPTQSRLIEPDVIDFALSPNGRYLVYRLQDGGLWQTEVRCSIPRQTSDCPGVPRPLVSSSDDPGFLRLRWSPDGGHLLAFSLPGQLWLLDAFSGGPQPVELDGAALYETNPWSPDSHQLILPLVYEGGMTNSPRIVYNVVTLKKAYLSGFDTFSKQREAAWGRAASATVEAVPIEPVVTAPSIRFDSWSPYDETLAYWSFTAEEAASSYLNPPGTLHFLNIRTDRTCPYRAAPGQEAQVIAWLTDGKVIVFSGRQSRQGTPCSDDFTPVPNPAADHTPAPNLALSPNGTYRANTISQVEANGTLSVVTTITNVITGRVEDVVEWKHPGGLGELGLGGQWLMDDRFLINETLDRGPLLVVVGKEIIEVAPKLFGVAPGVPKPDEDFVVLRATASVASRTQSYHIVLSGVGDEASFPPIRLYHSETGEVEELPLKYLWWQAFSPDGHWLLMDARPNKDGHETHEIWARPVDPIGSEPQWLISDVSSSLAWSPDGTKIAASSTHEVFVLSFPAASRLGAWQIGEYEGVPAAWSPDGQALAVQGYLAGRQQDALFVIQTPKY